jgi:TatD-related deoxyribonuclease
VPPIPVHDNHFHCRPDGHQGLGAVRRFLAAGGTSLAHVRLPTYPRDLAGFEASCRDHLRFSAEMAGLGVTVWPAVGPYPLEVMKVAEERGWQEARAFGLGCYRVAADLCAQGAASCIGEVGRAHFEVGAGVQGELNALLEEGMALARDAGVPIMLHTEHTTPQTMAEFAAMADRAGLERDRVVKHYCGPLVTQEETHGIVPSIIAGRSNIRAALAKGSRFLLETDYIDEPTRPDVVMPCDTVPKRTLGLLQNGEMTEAQAREVHGELPRRLYGKPPA